MEVPAGILLDGSSLLLPPNRGARGLHGGVMSVAIGG